MPYRRLYNNRGRANFYRKRPVFKGRTNRNRKLVTGHGPTSIERMANYAGAVGRVARTVAGIYRTINTEEKYHDNSINAAVDSVTGSIVHLTGIAQGDTDQTRNGNSLLGKCIQLKGSLLAGSISTVCRVMLICDKQANGAAPTFGQLLDTTGLPINALLNKDNSDRFTLLKELRLSVTINNSNIIPWNMFVKIPWHVRYAGASGGTSDTKENQLYLMAISAAAAGATSPTLAYSSRFKFYDN